MTVKPLSNALPFDGAISAFFNDQAPSDVVAAIGQAKRSKDVAALDFPYKTRLKKSEYESHMAILQLELAKFHHWVRATNQRIAIVFEGRDAAGKGGTIRRLTENMPPRSTNVVALSKPTNTEAGQWYFQRYIKHLPTQGSVTIFDRSWYNRGVVEHVFDFCTTQQREKFFHQVQPFEKMITGDGVSLVKIWLNVGRAEQLRRFLDREHDPLKQWKLSSIDVKGLPKWDAYSDAILETLNRSNHSNAPWSIIKSDDKRRARIAAIQTILTQFPYKGRDDLAIGSIDPNITGGTEVWND